MSLKNNMAKQSSQVGRYHATRRKKLNNLEIVHEFLNRKFLKILFPFLEYTELELGNKTRS